MNWISRHKVSILMVLSFTIFSLPAPAAERVNAGPIFGQPTGLSLSTESDSSGFVLAPVLSGGYRFGKGAEGDTDLLVRYQFAEAAYGAAYAPDSYLEVGGGMHFIEGDKPRLHIPFGIGVYFYDIDFFVELGISPSTQSNPLGWNGGVGFRIPLFPLWGDFKGSSGGC